METKNRNTPKFRFDIFSRTIYFVSFRLAFSNTIFRFNSLDKKSFRTALHTVSYTQQFLTSLCILARNSWPPSPKSFSGTPDAEHASMRRTCVDAESDQRQLQGHCQQRNSALQPSLTGSYLLQDISDWRGRRSVQK